MQLTVKENITAITNDMLVNFLITIRIVEFIEYHNAKSSETLVKVNTTSKGFPS